MSINLPPPRPWHRSVVIWFMADNATACSMMTNGTDNDRDCALHSRGNELDGVAKIKPIAVGFGISFKRGSSMDFKAGPDSLIILNLSVCELH